MATIRLSIGKDLLRLLKELKERRFPLLDNAEIIRAALSEYYTEHVRRDHAGALPELPMTKRERKHFWKEVDEARKDQGRTMSAEEFWDLVDSGEDV